MITNVTKPTFDLVLDFIYTGEMPLTRDTAEDVLRAAVTLQLPALHDMVDKYMLFALCFY